MHMCACVLCRCRALFGWTLTPRTSCGGAWWTSTTGEWVVCHSHALPGTLLRRGMWWCVWCRTRMLAQSDAACCWRKGGVRTVTGRSAPCCGTCCRQHSKARGTRMPICCCCFTVPCLLARPLQSCCPLKNCCVGSGVSAQVPTCTLDL